jgi:hypothetical protein
MMAQARAALLCAVSGRVVLKIRLGSDLDYGDKSVLLNDIGQFSQLLDSGFAGTPFRQASPAGLAPSPVTSTSSVLWGAR